MVHRERQGAVQAAIESLAERDREVVILRAIEQLPNQEVAARLGLDPSTVAARYRRALAHLRNEVPAAVFDDLAEH